MCYDHLGGTVGVAINQALLERDLVRDQDGAYLLGPGGADGFGALDIDIGHLEQRSRPLLRPCLDWSERRFHLAGSLGAALTATMLDRRWIATREASRVVAVTPSGESALHDWLGIDLAQVRHEAAA